MRILLVHNKYKQRGGEDSVFYAESELLVQQGHSVEHLVFENSRIRTPLDKFASAFKAIYNPSSARALTRKILDFSPDVIHFHNLFPLGSPSLLFAARKFNVPAVLTLHNYRLLCPSSTLYFKNRLYEKSIQSVFPLDAVMKGVYRHSIAQTAAAALTTVLHRLIGTWRNKVDRYIALTHFARMKFINSSISIPEEKLVVKPNAVPDHGVGDDTRGDFFLFIGRLTDEKGIMTLLAAAELNDFKLVIIGDGPLAGQVAESAKANPNISYLGFKEKADVVLHLRQCKALIFPSLWYEGFPLTLAEALCCGTVVIASRMGAMEEIIQDGVNGLLFEPGNERELADRMMDLNQHRVDTRLLSRNARASYLDNYTPERNHQALMRIYTEAMAQRRSPATNGEYGIPSLGRIESSGS